jgi:hypothetical protein
LDLLLSGKPTPLAAMDLSCNAAKISRCEPAGSNNNLDVGHARGFYESDGESERNPQSVNELDGLFVSADRRPQIRPFYSNALPPRTPSR